MSWNPHYFENAINWKVHCRWHRWIQAYRAPVSVRWINEVTMFMWTIVEGDREQADYWFDSRQHWAKRSFHKPFKDKDFAARYAKRWGT